MSKAKIYTKEDWALDRTFSAEIGQEVTEEIYDEMFDCMPPITLAAGTALNARLGIVAGFRVGESYIHAKCIKTVEFLPFNAAFGRTADRKHFYFLGNQNKYGEIYAVPAHKVITNEEAANGQVF